MFIITCQGISLHLPRVWILQQDHSQIRMGWHIHHMQPVSPRDKSVKMKFRASITHDYGDCSYWRLMGLLPYINSTYVTKFCSYLPELLFSWVWYSHVRWLIAKCNLEKLICNSHVEGLCFPEYKIKYVAENSVVQSFHYVRLCELGHKHWTDRSVLAFTGMYTELQFAYPVLGLPEYRMTHEMFTHLSFA